MRVGYRTTSPTSPRNLEGQDARRERAVRAVSIVLFALSASACTREAPPPPEPSASSATRPTTSTTHPATITIADGAGTVSMVLEAQAEGGYRVRSASGEKIGKLKIADGKAKFKDPSDAVQAEVKRKEDGYKLYRGEEAILKLKADDRGFKLKRGDDVLGKFRGDSLELENGDRISLATDGPSLVVSAAGRPLAHVKGVTNRTAALLLGLSEFTLEQRVTLMIALEALP